jgi:CHAT domain-containing protein
MAADSSSPEIVEVQRIDEGTPFEPVKPRSVIDGIAEVPPYELVKPRCVVDWVGGPKGQLEVFSIGEEPNRQYHFRYSTPWNNCVRPPIHPRTQFAQFDAENETLDRLSFLMSQMERARSSNDRGTNKQETTEIASDLEGALHSLGKKLHKKMFPHETTLHRVLDQEKCFVEISVDENMRDYPWELMRDDTEDAKEEFLCLKHYVGRTLNTCVGTKFSLSPARKVNLNEKLRILLIVVHEPRVNGFAPLLSAEIEGKILKSVFAEALSLRGLKPKENLVVLEKGLAQKTRLITKLEQERFHIIHFCGHGVLADPARPSALVLDDTLLVPNILTPNFAQAKPLLCFINACDSANAAPSKDRFSLGGLDKAVLETGSYFIGSRWKVSDGAAGRFAEEFYRSLLIEGEGRSIGEAVFRARIKCKEEYPDDFSWASYVFYGDPRVNFPQLARPQLIPGGGPHGRDRFQN